MTLIIPSILLPLADAVGKNAGIFLPAIDAANAAAKANATATYAAFTSDPTQGAAWYQGARTVYQSASGATGASGAASSNAFGGGGLGGGSFGTGAGMLNRQSLLVGGWNGQLEVWRQQIRSNAVAAGLTGVTGLSSYGIYENGLTPFSCLFTPDFATLYWYAYNQGQMLDASTVFAPSNIVMAAYAVTGAGAGTLTAPAANFPSANGYVAPSPTTDTYGNNVFIGGLPMAQGFAPTLAPAIKCTTNITGTGVVTVTALNQAGASRTWTATLTGLTTASAPLVLTPATAGDRMSGVPTAITIPAGVTAGAFTVITQAERTP